MTQKATLSAALNLAQSAVKFDSDNDVAEALKAYTLSCDLLSQVLGDDNVRDDHRKLRQIYETYNDRILLLQALHPRVEDRAHLLTSQLAASRRSDPREYASRADDSHYTTRAKHERQVSDTGALHNDGISISDASMWVDASGEDTFNPSRTVRERRAKTLESRGRYAPLNSLAPLSLQSSPAPSMRASQRRSSQTSRTSTESDFSRTRRSRMGSKETNASSTIDEEALKSPSFSPTTPSMPNQYLHRQPSLNLLNHNTARNDQIMVDKDRRQSMIVTTQSRSSSISTGQLNGSGKSIRSKMPKETLARPYWMMRLLLGTFATPRTSGSGIFITDSLFFPRDLWSTKNVKIKGEEEKIQAYTLVVHELQQLGRVDKDDIPSLFKSLDSFEKVLGSAQSILSKKLGGEVINSPTLPVRETPQTPAKKNSSLSFSKFLKNGTSDKENASPPSLRDFEGEHVALQRTTAQLFGLAQLLEQINLNLNTESLSAKDQERLDQTYSRAADFFSRVVVKLYLADASHLLHSRLAAKLHIA